ncbi:MAG: MFS transporter [Clostridia bacterium]|nr:MFS transporter [Clostridia bacterium]
MKKKKIQSSNHNRTLTILLMTQGSSLIGSRMTSTALGIWLFKTTGHVTYLLLIPFFNELPNLFVGPLTGVLVDRWQYKKSMILGDFGQVLGSLILLISLFNKGFMPVVLYSVVALQGIFASLQTVAADTLISELAENDKRDKVNGFKEMLFPVASFLGPALTGALYPFIGFKGILTLDLITFVLAVLIIFAIRLPNKAIQNSYVETKIHQELKIGFNFLCQNKPLLIFIVYFGFINFLLNGPLELVIPYVYSLTENEVMVSSMLSMMGIATAIGAYLMTRFIFVGKRIQSILLLTTLSGFMMILFGIFRQTFFLASSLFFLMMPLPMVSALFKSMLQHLVPQDLQGRVFSIAYQIAYGTAPLSFLIVGPLVDQLFEPKMMKDHPLVFLFGVGQGAGMGAVLTLAGSIIFVGSLSMFLYRRIYELKN